VEIEKEIESQIESGKVDVRFSKSTGKFRLRFHGVAPDQKETILLALERARSELETEYDAVALEAICMNYLSGGHAIQE
jgi:hypothetical protein